METSSNFGYSQCQSNENNSEEEDEERDHDDKKDSSYIPGNYMNDDDVNEGEYEGEHNQGHATEDNQEDDHNDYVNEDVNDTEDSCHVRGKVENDRNGSKRK